MSTFAAFEKAKLTRFVNVHGECFVFKRNIKNKYGDLKDELDVVAVIKGVYHEASAGYISEDVSNGSKTIKKIEPMILCILSETSTRVMPGDCVEVCNNNYKVSRVNMIGKLHYALDISLELIDDGSNIGFEQSHC